MHDASHASEGPPQRPSHHQIARRRRQVGCTSVASGVTIIVIPLLSRHRSLRPVGNERRLFTLQSKDALRSVEPPDACLRRRRLMLMNSLLCAASWRLNRLHGFEKRSAPRYSKARRVGCPVIVDDATVIPHGHRRRSRIALWAFPPLSTVGASIRLRVTGRSGQH